MTSGQLLTISVVCAFGAVACFWQVRQALRATSDHPPATTWGHISQPVLDTRKEPDA
jgi:uncharacterized membrane protein YqjE